ncbi:MAG: rRNA (guanine527-N7)-methyltransferase [Acidobacteriota bacterium]|jgi:16S rRNA (guanine527-N7)-methyltransferase|nr:rRNA (guanine527-N7)-methyltransferase [Acidobacteriota bacterium]
MDRNSSRTDEFTNALAESAPRYDVRLNAQAIRQLQDYYELLLFWNTRLHLVAPCSPAEFATRHVLESLCALPHISEAARVVDVGSGAGLPIIPCLIAWPSFHATLIESSQKKAIFLREALRTVGAQGSSELIAERFEMTLAPEAEFITCRALERMTKMFKQLLDWSPRASTLLLFGGEALRTEIEMFALTYQTIHIPESERRFLFVIKKHPQT